MKYGVQPEKTFGPGYPEGTRWRMCQSTWFDRDGKPMYVYGRGRTAFEAAASTGHTLSQLVIIEPCEEEK